MGQTPIKKVIPKEVAIIHHCTQEDRVKRIELILIGNGHPEDGYVYKVIQMAKSLDEINTHITGISGTVTELYNESIQRKAVLTKEDYRFEKAIKIAGVILAFGLLLIGYFNLTKKIDQRFDQIGMPVVTNARGVPIIVPDSTEIKFFPNDSLSYTIIKKK